MQHGVEDDGVSGELQLMPADNLSIILLRGQRSRKDSDSYLMKTSMMDLQTSTLTLSFWNMSRNGRKRS